MQIGGYTFAEDPSKDCTCVIPVWSAAVDPYVLRARVLPNQQKRGRSFDIIARRARYVANSRGEHIAFDCHGEVARIDVVEGTLAAGRANLCFEIVGDDEIEYQISALHRIYSSQPRVQNTSRLRRQHLALLAADARKSGASLRTTADLLLGAGEWPGDGDCRKSQIRRLVVAGSALCRLGPEAIFRQV